MQHRSDTYTRACRLTKMGSLTLATVLALTGCTSISKPAPPVTVTPPVSSSNITGNWGGNVTPSVGTPLPLFGSIDQSGGETSSGQFTTSVLHITSSCFSAIPDIPSQGFVQGNAVTLNSFAVDGQYLNLTGTSADNGSSISGTFSIYGNCANGLAGNFSINRYAVVGGTYSGTLNATSGVAYPLSLSVTQMTGANGAGGFEISGTATLSGAACFAQGTASQQSQISGPNATFAFVSTNGATLALSGVFDVTTSHLTQVSYVLSGGTCGSQTGSGVLDK
jgi:hypothetical protein